MFEPGDIIKHIETVELMEIVGISYCGDGYCKVKDVNGLVWHIIKDYITMATDTEKHAYLNHVQNR